MIFIIIDRIKAQIQWLRWCTIMWFCPHVVDDMIRECDINWFETKWSIRRGQDREPIKRRHRCDYDMCPKMKRGEP